MALVLDGDNGIIGVLATNTDGDVIFDTNTLFVDAVENKVGIGTITPVRQLHLASSVPSIRLEDTDVSGAYNDIVHLSTGELSIRVDHGNVQSNSSLSFLIDADEKMRIDTDGNVGIGAPNTSVFNGVGGNSRLVVKGSDSSTNILNNSNASITIANDDGTASNTSALHFARADTDDNPHYAGASIVAQFDETQVTGQYPKGQLAFLTSTASNTAPSEKMRIDSAGNVIFNDTSSATRVSKSIQANTNNYMYVTGGSAGLFAQGDTDGSERIVISNSTEQIRFYTQNAERLDITSAGIDVTGTLTATALAGSGDNITGVAKISNASTPPSVGAAGTMYYNTTAGVLYISNGAAWVQSYKNPANGSSSGSAAEYGSDIIALGLGAGLYWLTGRIAANRTAQQVYVDADGWMLFYRHAGTGSIYNATYEIKGDTLGEGAVGTLTSPTQGLTDAGSSTAAGSRGVARLATDFIRSLGGDSAANNVYRVTTGSVTAYITDVQWWSTADGSSDGYGRASISCGDSYANRRSTSGTPDVGRPMGTYNLYGPANVIPWYHGNGYSGGYNPAESWHISTTCWVREF